MNIIHEFLFPVGPATYGETEEDAGGNFIGDYDDYGGVDSDSATRPSFVSALPLPKRASPFYTEKTLALRLVPRRGREGGNH